MSGLLGLAGSIGGTFLNWISNKNNNATNIELQQMANDANWRINQAQLNHADQAATTAYNRQIEFYNMFQSPAAMMRQLREAGLSPGLMYGQGGAGGSGASSVAQAQTPAALAMQAAQTRPLLDAQLAMMLSQIEKTKAETRKDNADAAKSEGELPKIQQEIKNLEETNTQIKENIKKTAQEISNLVTEQAARAAEQGKTEQESELIKLQQRYQELSNQLAEIQVKWGDEMAQQQLEEVKTHIKEMNAAAEKMGAEKKTILEQNKAIIKLYTNQAQKYGMEAKYLIPAQSNALWKSVDKCVEEIAKLKSDKDRQEAINRYWDEWKKLVGERAADALRVMVNMVPMVES